MKMPIDEIEVGARHRHDMGDIAALKASIEAVGLIQAVAVTPDKMLVAGERRLAAVRSLGWVRVPVQIVHNLDDAAKLLQAERDENTCRKAFTPTEEHALYEALLDLERPKAEERMSAGGKGVEVSHPSRAKAAAAEAATGSAGRRHTLDKVGEVKAIANDETKPEPVRQVAEEALADMDASGRVDGAYQRVKDAERVAATPQPNQLVSEHLESSQAVEDARYVKAFLSALTKADDFLMFDAERLSRLLDESEAGAIERYAASVRQFSDRVRRSRRGLQVLSGGRE